MVTQLPKSMRTAIVFVTDERGLHLAECAAAAAMLTQSDSDFLVFCSGFIPKLSPLRDAADLLDRKFSFRPLNTNIDITNLYQGDASHHHITSTSLLKMEAIWSLKGEYDRVVYIDYDILLMRDLSLNYIDLEGRPIAAVYDIAMVGEMGSHQGFAENCAQSGVSTHYFNSGFIIVDLELLRLVDINMYHRELVRHKIACDFDNNCRLNDQCAWNTTFSRNWTRLPLVFNLQACVMFNDVWRTAGARHFVGPKKFLPIKPWRNDAKDFALLAEIHQLFKVPFNKKAKPLLLWLNRLRNTRRRADAKRAMAILNKLFMRSVEE